MQLIAILTLFSIQLFARTSAKETCPLVLGHRGAPGLYPEDTAIGYEKAVEFGADFIECDIQVTKDLQLVCSHDQWIKDVCNVENFEEFSNRLTTFWDTPYGDIIDNFFIIDFEVAELKQLLRKQLTKGMAIWVVKFPREGYKIRSIFAQKSCLFVLGLGFRCDPRDSLSFFA